MTLIRDILDRKGPELWSIGPDASVLDALRLMAEKGVGALVVAEGDRLLGIFSERDYARKVVLEGRTSHDTKVRDIMTADVIRVTPRETLEQCMVTMTQKRIRHLPVVEGEKLVGVVSIGDLVKGVIEEQEYVIGQLKNYIAT